MTGKSERCALDEPCPERWNGVTLEPDEKLLLAFHENPAYNTHTGFLVAAILAILGIWWSWLWFVSAFFVVFALVNYVIRKESKYAITNKRVMARVGVFNKTATQIRRERITDVTVKRPFMNNTLEIGEVHINTAGHSGKALVIRFLPDPDAVADLLRADVHG